MSKYPPCSCGYVPGSRSSAYRHSKIHPFFQDGVAVFKEAISRDSKGFKSAVARLKRFKRTNEASRIKNPGKKDHPTRKQLYVPTNYADFFLQRVRAIVDGKNNLQYVPRTYCEHGVHLIWSDPGCLTQRFHYDVNPEVVGNMPDVNKPTGVILALENGVVFITRRKTYVLEAGDLLLFRADVLHRGAGYERVNNLRLHWIYNDEERTGEMADTIFWEGSFDSLEPAGFNGCTELGELVQRRDYLLRFRLCPLCGNAGYDTLSGKTLNGHTLVRVNLRCRDNPYSHQQITRMNNNYRRKVKREVGRLKRLIVRSKLQRLLGTSARGRRRRHKKRKRRMSI